METVNAKELKFKTNINCSGCVEKVTPSLNAAKGIAGWKVDTDNKDKILTVVPSGISDKDVQRIVEAAGFRAEKVEE